jgi:hypothetical protein
MVWAHEKLDTNNPDEIVPYLSSTINERPEEANSCSPSEASLRSSTPVVVHSHSSSLFKDYEERSER